MGNGIYFKIARYVDLDMLNKSLTYMVFFTAILITYIKGVTPAQIFLEKGSAMTRGKFVIFLPKLSSFIWMQSDDQTFHDSLVQMR
jgi:hypothetical protein